MHCFSASPCPWKKRKDSMKSAMKINTRLITTALVVDSPTPLAPPVVVKPQLQLTCMSSKACEVHVHQDSGQHGCIMLLRKTRHATCLRTSCNAAHAHGHFEGCRALTTAMMVPNTQALMQDVTISQEVMARHAESNMTFAETPYTLSARPTLAARPATLPTMCALLKYLSLLVCAEAGD